MSMDQFGLFGQNEVNEEVIIDYDGQCIYYPNFFSEDFFSPLNELINWRQDKITLYGKTHNVPRLHAWYNDDDQSYSYSNINLPVNSFIKELNIIRTEIETKLGERFNSCLCNLYRDGNDYAAIHSDDETELGKNPIIASASFGEERKFVLKHRTNRGIEKKEILLENRSLVLMKGPLQHHWKHELTKTKKKIGPRVNLTFRNIVT